MCGPLLRRLFIDSILSYQVSTNFDPLRLRLTEDGKLFHAVRTKGTDAQARRCG